MDRGIGGSHGNIGAYYPIVLSRNPTPQEATQERARNSYAKCKRQWGALLAIDLDKVLRFLNNADDRYLYASHRRNGQIDGSASNGYSIPDNSEASLLQAFSRKGYDVLHHLQT